MLAKPLWTGERNLAWRNRPIEGEHPYVYLDGIVLKRSWAGEVRNVHRLSVARAVASGPPQPPSF
jgi:transposase-like protein